MLALLALALVAAGGLWVWYRSGTEAEGPGPAPVAADPAERPSIPPPEPADDDLLELPPLDASDAFVRDLGAQLSAHPRLAAWLVTDELIHRFVSSVVLIAAGSSPAEHVSFLVPEEEFAVQRSGERLSIAPASYRRYDLFAETFTSLDTEGTVRLYRQLLPLLEQAHVELGYPEGTFHETLAEAIRNLRAAQVPEDPPEVVPHRAVYEFRDAAVAERTQAEKHLLRMGPQNARRVQAKLGEISVALGLP